MVQKNKYIGFIALVTFALLMLVLLAALFIERHFSKRAEVKDMSVRIAQKEKMINEYGAQEIILTTADKKKIAALCVQRPAAKRIFLLAHGFKKSKEALADFLDIFPEDTLFFIDFRGHGQSEGDSVSLGLDEHLDLVAAVDYIKEHISSTVSLFGIGISMGGAALLRAAVHAPFDGVISDSAPSSFKDTITTILYTTRHIPWPLAWLALSWYEILMGRSLQVSHYTHYAPLVTCPTLVIHDEHDPLIPFYHAENIYHSLHVPCKILYKTAANSHAKMFKQSPDAYKATIQEFIRTCSTY